MTKKRITRKNEKEKEYGLKIREILKERILNKIVKVYFEGLDKYGRYLADVIYENENINEQIDSRPYTQDPRPKTQDPKIMQGWPRPQGSGL